MEPQDTTPDKPVSPSVDALLCAQPPDRSETLGKLAASLAQLQVKLSGMSASGNNPHYKSTYSTLEDAWKAIREALPGTGLSVAQFPEARDGVAGVVTYLLHESGEWLRGSLLLPFDGGRGSKAQAAGSAITYARRYSLMSVLGLATEDDDAEGTRRPRDRGASGRQRAPRQERRSPPPPSAHSEVLACAKTLQAMGDRPEQFIQFLTEFAGAKTIRDLTQEQAEEVLAILRREIAMRQQAEQSDPYTQPDMHGAE